MANTKINTDVINDNAITTSKIANDAITNDKIAANSVNAEQLNVSGNGALGQMLLSAGNGSFNWGSSVSGSNASNGYVELSNGLIINWGYTGLISNGSFYQVTFAKPFTTAMFGIQRSSANSNGYTGGTETYTTNRTLSGLRIYHRGFDTYTGSMDYWFIAYGY